MGIPALVLLVPAASALLHNALVMGALAALSFGLIGTSLLQGWKRHRRVGPGLLALLAAGFAIADLGHVLPQWGMAASSALLVSAWFWARFGSTAPVSWSPQQGKETDATH